MVCVAVVPVVLNSRQAIAQTSKTESKEPDRSLEEKWEAVSRLFQQGLQQDQVSQFQDAIQLFNKRDY